MLTAPAARGWLQVVAVISEFNISPGGGGSCSIYSPHWCKTRTQRSGSCCAASCTLLLKATVCLRLDLQLIFLWIRKPRVIHRCAQTFCQYIWSGFILENCPNPRILGDFSQVRFGKVGVKIWKIASPYQVRCQYSRNRLQWRLILNRKLWLISNKLHFICSGLSWADTIKCVAHQRFPLHSFYFKIKS